VRLVVAECSIDYTGRLSAHLPLARRLIVVKADGTVIVHGDKGHKALNWMSPPNTIVERSHGWTVTGSGGDRLEITIAGIHSDTTIELGIEPGLQKAGSEYELQWLLAQSPDVIEPGARLVTREFPTDLGPVDLLLRAADGGTVAVEVKRVGELQAVVPGAGPRDPRRADHQAADAGARDVARDRLRRGRYRGPRRPRRASPDLVLANPVGEP
jgi:RecB family endonuclease NucS